MDLSELLLMQKKSKIIPVDKIRTEEARILFIKSKGKD